MKILTRPGLLFAAIGCLIASIAAYSFIKKKYSEHIANPITSTKPERKNMVQFVNASGNLKAKEQITIGSLVGGKIEKWLVDDNDVVKKGQLLAVLDDGVGNSNVKKIQADLLEAEATLDYQEKFYRRQTALYKAEQLSKNLYDQYTQNYKVALAKVEQIKANLEMAQKTYDNLFIKAPENGTVISRQIDVGQMITAQLQATILYELAKDLTDMEVWIDVDEADIGMVKEDQSALFTVDAFPKMRFNAKVRRIRYQAKNVDNVITYATVLGVKNPEKKLRPGMTANVDIKVGECTNAIAVPNKALRINILNLEEAAKMLNMQFIKANPDNSAPKTELEKKVKGKVSPEYKEYLWVIENGSAVRQVEVKLGVTDGKFIEVKEGITAETAVITEVEPIKHKNVLLSGVFGRPSGIGGK